MQRVSSFNTSLLCICTIATRVHDHDILVPSANITNSCMLLFKGIKGAARFSSFGDMTEEYAWVCALSFPLFLMFRM